jgi:hypothetical protein
MRARLCRHSKISDLFLDDSKALVRYQGMQFGGELPELFGEGQAQHFTVNRARKKTAGPAPGS